MKKEITMDFELYENEKKYAERRGFKSGIRWTTEQLSEIFPQVKEFEQLLFDYYEGGSVDFMSFSEYIAEKNELKQKANQ